MRDATEAQPLAVLVRKMRAAQKAYFRTRDRVALETAQRLEHYVDRALDELDGGRLPFEEAR